ncbi:MAG: hypothetical protein KC776_41415 [Myxococcales bacterium]|nr:hypothetical protein [Myxococcales bacterium]MCB9577327.1 hypothetical protein [Polyangiaceae bacterium]
MQHTLRALRDEYFRSNGFGEDGGYSAAWVDFKLGPIPFPFPNSPARRKAVPYHDLHHLLTGYGTDFLSELEISAWEIGAGCKNVWIAWHLNLSGMATGAALIPRRVFRAFVRGRRSETLYGRDLEALLSMTPQQLTQAAEPPRARVSDVLLFALSLSAGGVLALLTLALLLPIAPPAAVVLNLRRRAALAQ